MCLTEYMYTILLNELQYIKLSVKNIVRPIYFEMLSLDGQHVSENTWCKRFLNTTNMGAFVALIHAATAKLPILSPKLVASRASLC